MHQQAANYILREEVGAIATEGHFVYPNGQHGRLCKVDISRLYPHTEKTSRLCLAIAQDFLNDDVGVVVAPATGGIVLSQWVGYHLSMILRREVPSVYAEKEGNVFLIKHDYDKIVAGKRVLVLDEVLNVEGPAKKLVEAVRNLGGNVVGVGALCNRGGITPRDSAVPKVFALVDLKFEAWGKGECPMCAEGIPIEKGSGY